ncbi:DUF4350 domain-containing protein [Pareuzebyella sediminis]|uniref:DUF4350 domain-containing protein n=1 Tax=Pareuzebyella sediminis TaxID=2607998 RepID=UPI0011EC76DE|nr:DUF4350 domain-containing protein [Pareuzebyella sediminis]
MVEARKGIGYVFIALTTLAIMLLFLYNKPKEVNWFPSYVSTHKIPYGTKVLDDILFKLFPKTQAVFVSPFEFLEGNTQVEGTYFFVNDRIAFGETELERILNWTSEGNSLFIASTSFDEQLLDTLGIKIGNFYGGFRETKSYAHQMVHPKLRSEEDYFFDKGDYAIVVDEIDTLKTSIIATVNIPSHKPSGKNPAVDAIKRKFGQGDITLSTFPQAFTNYFILKENNSKYTAGLLSYIDVDRNLYLDHYHKSGKTTYTSPMHIFLNTKEFKWAYYLVVFGALVYVFFEGKRKQRAVPVVKSLKNQTLAFTKTIADMYYQTEGNEKEIAKLKINHFLEYIRSRFRLGTLEREDDFYHNLASRSSNTIEDVKKLFQFIERIQNQENISNFDLQKLNKAIEAFKIRTYDK